MLSDIEIKSNGGIFLKIESGKKYVIRLLQDNPQHRVIHGFGPTSVECLGDDCLKCQEVEDDGKPTASSKRTNRFKLNVYSHDTKKVMLWEFGAGVLKALQGVEEGLKTQGLNILEVDLMVSAKGEKMEKKYTVQPMLKSLPVPTGLVLLPFESRKNEVPF